MTKASLSQEGPKLFNLLNPQCQKYSIGEIKNAYINELLSLLRVLPTAMLVEVLSTRGILCAMGGEAPDVAAGLDAPGLALDEVPAPCYAPIWDVDCYVCRHCRQARLSHFQEQSGVLRCPEPGKPPPIPRGECSFLGEPAVRTSTASNNYEEEV